MPDEPKFFIATGYGEAVALTRAIIARGAVAVRGVHVEVYGESGALVATFLREGPKQALEVAGKLLEWAGASAADLAAFRGA